MAGNQFLTTATINLYILAGFVKKLMNKKNKKLSFTGFSCNLTGQLIFSLCWLAVSQLIIWGEMMVTEEKNFPADTCLRIFTLGRFEVYRNGIQLSERASRSSRVWDLFKYLLTCRDRSSTPEAIIETLWPQHNYTDMRKALRTPIYRLRQILQNDS